MNAEMPIAVIIDDDADIRTLLDRVLTQSGFQTVLTANAFDGVAAVEEFAPLVTMLDVSMPGMDGFAAARKIREFSETYVVMLTALSDEIDVIQGLGAGADDYLVKPFRPRELRARVETLLRRPRQRIEDPPLAPGGHAAPESAPREQVWTADQRRGHADPGPRPPAATPRQPYPAASQQPQQPAQPAQPEEQVAYQPEQPEPHVGPPAPGIRSDAAGRTVVDQPVVHELRPTHADGEWVAYHGLRLNAATGAVFCDDRPITLNPSELALLSTLLESGRRVRSTANLVLTLRGESYVTTYYVNEADKNTVKEHMVSLRRKLGDTDVTPRWIESVRGVGYRMAQD